MRLGIVGRRSISVESAGVLNRFRFLRFSPALYAGEASLSDAVTNRRLHEPRVQP